MNENQNNLTEEISEQDINILKKVRLEKLDELKSKNAKQTSSSYIIFMRLQNLK